MLTEEALDEACCAGNVGANDGLSDNVAELVYKNGGGIFRLPVNFPGQQGWQISLLLCKSANGGLP